MKPFFISACLVLLFACKEKKSPAPSAGQTKPAAADSASQQEDALKLVDVERAHFAWKDYSLSVKSQFLLPHILQYDSSYYFECNYVLITNKKSYTTDTLHMDGMVDQPSNVAIEVVPDSLHFNVLAFDISWEGYSDMPSDEFVSYTGNKLTERFESDNLVSVYRKGKDSFSVFVTGRDELVASGEHDYPFTVSVKDREVHVESPPVQYIGYNSTALAAIKGYRVSAQGDTAAYTIKKGTPLVVDTLYRSKGLVRLIVSDSIIIRVRVSTVSGKLQSDVAG